VEYFDYLRPDKYLFRIDSVPEYSTTAALGRSQPSIFLRCVSDQGHLATINRCGMAMPVALLVGLANEFAQDALQQTFWLALT
jgi:hypothetical protein